MRLALVALAVAACNKASEQLPPPPPGPPPTTGDCQRVAEFFASYDLGNYAEPEERAPVVAKYKADCVRAEVTAEQAACVEKERAKWHAAQCVPKMVPELAAKDPECRALADRLKAVARGDVDERRMHAIELTIGALWESCEQDAWPGALKVCMTSSHAVEAEPSAIYDCASQMPGDLQQKINERIAKALQQGWH